MKKEKSLVNKSMMKRAIKDSFIKLNPKVQIQNPVMFIVYIASSCHQICIHSPLPHKSNTPEDRMHNTIKGVLRLSTSTFSFIKK